MAAINELIEFLATLAHHGTHVGGIGTGWDLLSNIAGVADTRSRCDIKSACSLSALRKARLTAAMPEFPLSLIVTFVALAESVNGSTRPSSSPSGALARTVDDVELGTDGWVPGTTRSGSTPRATTSRPTSSKPTTNRDKNEAEEAA